ncbi:MAG: hypothetical protein KGJ15_01445 [Betaproteobacteria bacterium]|nr:hypothetical protein [Betaproteobacteria bacterium]MDE2131402.1 hypothetical protein [Betaproteobacteria bacterium]MDE2625488.1 hypothetical protein [Betaproteobacteria bacterium]
MVTATPNFKIRGILAVFVGMAFNALGDWLLGVKIEVFRGIATFTFPWMVDVFLVPFLTGMVVARVYGKKGGKWLACLPPLVVRAASYAKLYYLDHAPGDFFYSLHLHYWGPCVILAVESANLGGILSEVLVGAYSRKKLEAQ